METVKCDLCGAREYQILFSQTDIIHKTTTEWFQMVRCRDCELHYLNPRPEPAEIKKYYSEDYTYYNRGNELKSGARDMLRRLVNNAYFNNRGIFTKVLMRTLALPLYLPKLKKKMPFLLVPEIKSYLDINVPKRILDIGCGSGEDTHMYGSSEAIICLERRGWDVYGIEPSEKARSAIMDKKLKNIKIYTDLYQASFENDYFDVIRLNWSLEHIHRPTDYLLECKRILNKDGKLIIGIPNYNGITYKIFPRCVEVPVHLYYFCTDTFKKYCKKLEFKIMDYYTFSYVPLFLNSLELMGHSSVYQHIMNNPGEAVKLQTFLNLMARLELGDDMVFCLSK